MYKIKNFVRSHSCVINIHFLQTIIIISITTCVCMYMLINAYTVFGKIRHRQWPTKIMGLLYLHEKNYLITF